MKEESMRNMIEGLEEALGVNRHFEPDVVYAFEKSLEEMEEMTPEYKGLKEAYTNTLIEIMKVPQQAQGIIITCLMHKCLYINEIPALIEHEKDFITSYIIQRLGESSNPIARLATAAFKSKINE